MTAHKMTKRAAALFPWSSAADNCAPLLRVLAAYAAQNPGLEFGNYCSGWNDRSGRAAYLSEARSITRDIHRVRAALHAAYFAGTTDADILEAARHAFSGRLSLARRDDGRWSVEYCTGQYWPTEYRKACAAVLDLAACYAQRRAEAARAAAAQL
jgi:hypothetical protein